MSNRVVKLFYPLRLHEACSKGLSVKTCKTAVCVDGDDIYKTVDKFRKEHFPVLNETVKTVEPSLKLSQIITLHNLSGIDEYEKIQQMKAKIDSGRDILAEDQIPNSKLVRTKKNETVLFDGHHTVLAYMIAGRQYLAQIPHLLIADNNGNGLSDREILVFFGRFSDFLSDKNWRRYRINWNHSPNGKLEPRRQTTLGDLREAIRQEGEI